MHINSAKGLDTHPEPASTNPEVGPYPDGKTCCTVLYIYICIYLFNIISLMHAHMKLGVNTKAPHDSSVGQPQSDQNLEGNWQIVSYLCHLTLGQRTASA